MRLILTATDSQFTEAWTSSCGDLECVTIHGGSIFEVPSDAVVSPANSYGFMDGGIDALYSQRFGWKVQDRLQSAILERHHGELLVGAAEIVETDDLRMPFLIAAPTMRIPMVLGPETVNPYLAIRAVLLLVMHGVFTTGRHAGERISDHVECISFPGMGTGVGQVPAKVCAHQLRQAVEDCLLKRASLPQSWREASVRHQMLYADRVRYLQN